MIVYIINAKRAFKPLKIIALILIFAVLSTDIVKGLDASDYESTSAEIGPVIIIDAGHGGEDPGAIGINGIYEKDVNLDIALTIGEELKAKGYTVVYTRTEDKMLYLPEENIKGMRKISDLKNRCKIGAENDNALFVSIHMNSFESSKYSGLQVYYSDNDQESYSLAHSVQNSVKTNLQPDNNRVVKSGKNIYILKHLVNTSILVECGFLTNVDECAKLCDKDYQKKLASFIASGIADYLEKRI